MTTTEQLKQHTKTAHFKKAKIKKFNIAAVMAIIGILIGCENTDLTKQQIGTGIGVAIGTAAGSLFGEGSGKAVEGLFRCPRFRWHEAAARRIMRRHGPEIRLPDRIPASVPGRGELRALPVRAALAGWVHLPRMWRDAVLPAEEPCLYL